ncbi:MFS transporter [Sphingorhabdus sp.]|uniref:MFS transporter n=1 Tax=Sphingorhabdus sp. TaxID=1902408 RepID=UPI003982FF69
MNDIAQNGHAVVPGIKSAASGRQSPRFMYLYALAVSGGAVAYIPFLTILLPVRATALAGDGALNLLAIAAFAGAIAASIANICFGWASDITGTRRPYMCAGLILSTGLLLAIPLATSAAMLIAMIVLWQVGLNMMLAPMAALAGDSIPDSQKGMLGGLLALAPALGALSGALVTLDGVTPFKDRETLVALIVVLLVLPLLLMGKPVPMPHLVGHNIAEPESSLVPRSATLRMWFARLLVQIAEASLFAFLLLWFRSLDSDFRANDAASIFALVLGLAVFLALMIGRWSDRANRPILPLVYGSGFAAGGLLIMAFAPSLPIAIAGYVTFGLASSIFLALHSSQTLRVLPRNHTRGRDLGIFNLTNTFPSLIMPWLTLALVPNYGFSALFVLLAGLATGGCLLLLTLPRRVTEI